MEFSDRGDIMKSLEKCKVEDLEEIHEQAGESLR